MIVMNKPMPKNCDKCLFSSVCEPYKQQVEKIRESNNQQVFDCFSEMRLSDCPIVGEIPDKHGRLIDADKLLPESGYDPMMFKPKYEGDHRTQYDTLMGYEILGIVENAPTILEATE